MRNGAAYSSDVRFGSASGHSAAPPDEHYLLIIPAVEVKNRQEIEQPIIGRLPPISIGILPITS
jgi:hypothetical protein